MKQIYNYLIIVFWPNIDMRYLETVRNPMQLQSIAEGRVCISDNPVGMR